MEFENQKIQRIEHIDLSRKGSIDEPIVELVSFINALPNYFTTSSCSGRIIVFENAVSDDQVTSQGNLSKPGKKGCTWIYVSHSKVKACEVEQCLSKVSGNAVLKFEAMVMHIQCHTLQDAQHMHQAAVASGFRNSGISVGSKGKIITGIRSTHGLEVPLSKDGALLVTPEYCQFLIECANEKMEENFVRIQRFYENVKLLVEKNSTKKLNEKHKKHVAKSKSSLKSDSKQAASVSVSMRNHYNEGQDLNNSFSNKEEEELSLFMFENT